VFSVQWILIFRLGGRFCVRLINKDGAVHCMRQMQMLNVENASHACPVAHGNQIASRIPVINKRKREDGVLAHAIQRTTVLDGSNELTRVG